ncbi:Sporozoite surface protein 2 [Senna tora]|uniref:Sporozoite surface protein 2 n=1 Tax=Senna tora TaxID=362788 RepID=A0A835C506_9FABA|nr:Sporozoite surface protein 2 [Senna tora]
MDCYFIVKVHHGGRFEHKAQLEYVGGESIYWENCDMDRWSFFEMKSDLDAMGYKGNYDLWYANPNGRLEDQLKPIIDDTQAMDMARLEQVLALPSTEPVEEEGKTSEEESSEGEDEEESSKGEDAQSSDDNNEEATEEGDKEEEVHTSQGGHNVYGSEDSDSESVEDSAASITFGDSEVEDISRGFNIAAEEHNVFEIETENWLARKFESKLRSNPKTKIKELVDMAKRKWSQTLKYMDQTQSSSRGFGRDPNDQMLPVAFSVVEVESKDTWSWLLELLTNDLGPAGTADLCIISDQQKATKSTYPVEWEKIMLEMRGVDENAYKHLLAISPRFWSKSIFNTTQHCDALLNNMSETFNSVIFDLREKPILTMLEAIREYLMNRWADSRKKITTHQESVLPRIKARLEKQVDMAGKWIPQWSGDEIFEVTSVYQATDKFVVDLQKKECSCRAWMLTGIPCCHSIAAMNFMRKTPDVYIPACFRKECYEECYAHIIYPTNGPTLWHSTQFP